LHVLLLVFKCFYAYKVTTEPLQFEKISCRDVMNDIMSRYMGGVDVNLGHRGNLVYVAREFKWCEMFVVRFRYSSVFDFSWSLSFVELCGFILILV